MMANRIDENNYPLAFKVRDGEFSKDFKNKLHGYPVIILGNGPSINDYDLSILNDYFTIGINRIFLANFVAAFLSNTKLQFKIAISIASKVVSKSL